MKSGQITIFHHEVKRKNIFKSHNFVQPFVLCSSWISSPSLSSAFSAVSGSAVSASSPATVASAAVSASAAGYKRQDAPAYQCIKRLGRQVNLHKGDRFFCLEYIGWIYRICALNIKIPELNIVRKLKNTFKQKTSTKTEVSTFPQLWRFKLQNPSNPPKTNSYHSLTLPVSLTASSHLKHTRVGSNEFNLWKGHLNGGEKWRWWWPYHDDDSVFRKKSPTTLW